MQTNNTKFLFSNEETLIKSFKLISLSWFSENALNFLSGLSIELRNDPRTRLFPDVATFAFFIRKSNLLKISEKYINDSIKIGRGVVFHISPSNVPVNFAYSMTAGILSGNINIVRVPTKEFEQVEIICEALNRVIENPLYSFFKEYLYIIRYNKNDIWTEYLSHRCDVRVIWGGDHTINEVRKAPIPPKSFDITFSDRYSIALLNADSIIDMRHNTEILAKKFFNDTYLFDQNACTSPHLIIWNGDENKVLAAKDIFWSAVQKTISDYQLSDLHVVDKLSKFYLYSTQIDGMKKTQTNQNKLWRIELTQIPSDIEDLRCYGGFFYEYRITSLKELQKIISKRFQTMSYFGFEKQVLKQFVMEHRLLGIDRIVPVGQSMDFSLVWDGYDLPIVLTRECVVS